MCFGKTLNFRHSDGLFKRGRLRPSARESLDAIDLLRDLEHTEQGYAQEQVTSRNNNAHSSCLLPLAYNSHHQAHVHRARVLSSQRLSMRANGIEQGQAQPAGVCIET